MTPFLHTCMFCTLFTVLCGYIYMTCARCGQACFLAGCGGGGGGGVGGGRGGAGDKFPNFC